MDIDEYGAKCLPCHEGRHNDCEYPCDCMICYPGTTRNPNRPK